MDNPSQQGPEEDDTGLSGTDGFVPACSTYLLRWV